MNANTQDKTINALLGNDSSISDLYKRGCYIKNVENKLKMLLDPSLENHFTLANINADNAVLITKSSAWATRLRYNIPQILAAFQNNLDLVSIKTIRIKIINQYEPPVIPGKQKKTTLSSKSAQLLKDASDNVNDPKIRQCYLNLSKHRAD